MSLNKFLSQQNLNQNGDQDNSLDTEAFILFSVKKSFYAIDIRCVREIVEYKKITPYPEHRSGHVGIISLRGSMVPVLEFPRGENSLLPHEENRILVIEFDEGGQFALQVKSTKRVEISREEIERSIVNVSNSPVQILNHNSFLGEDEVA